MKNNARSFRDAMIRVAAFVIVVFAVGGTVGAVTYYVAPGGDDLAAGTSWETALRTISNAVAKADVSEVVLSNGTYTLTEQIVVEKNITIRGDGATRDDVIIDGDNVTRCFYLFPENGGQLPREWTTGIALERMTIINGNALALGATEKGGGVCFEVTTSYARAAIRDCVVRDSTAYQGGGVYFRGYYGTSITNSFITGNTATSTGGGVYLYISYCAVENCVVSNNHALGEVNDGAGGIKIDQGGRVISSLIVSNSAIRGGGGILMTYAAPAIVSNCVIKGNWLETGLYVGGGGIVLRGDNCLLVNSTIVDNDAGPSGAGGGVATYQGSGSMIANCVIISNRATSAGGVMLKGTTPGTLRNSLIAHNTTGGDGGGVRWSQYSGVSGAVVENCTIAFNTAGGDSGGLYASVTGAVVNTIVYFNQALTGSNSNIFNTGAGQTYSNSCAAPIAGLTGSGNKEADPRFVNPDAGNFRLRTRSPCIDAGLNQTWMDTATDLDGNARRHDGTDVDIGAYEYIPPPAGMFFFGY